MYRPQAYKPFNAFRCFKVIFVCLCLIAVAVSICICGYYALCGGLNPDYSDGTRVGELYKISRKGIFWKSRGKAN